MQNRYVGDIGDYFKLMVLRAITPRRRPGVGWWLYPDEDHNKDGRHTRYLSDAAKWRGLDPDLFDALCGIVNGGRRDVAALQEHDLLPDAIYSGELIATTGKPSERGAARLAWFERVREALADCDLVFADPNNGLKIAHPSPETKQAGKGISLCEIRSLCRDDRCIVIYHHHTRAAGGHLKELGDWGRRLGDLDLGAVDALRAKSFSPRAFFLLNASPEMRDRAARLAARCGDRLTWHPNLAL